MLLAPRAKKARRVDPYRFRMKRAARHACERCERPVVAVRAHWGWRAAFGGTFAFFVVLTFLVGASGFLLFGAGAVVFALGALVMGPLYDLAAAPPKCPHCGCVVEKRVTGAAAERGRALDGSRRHQPA
jgi:hypothetical protein